MPLKFYNTLTKQKEIFTSINRDEVRMYTCGPTVYNYTHIGNLRAFVFADVLSRTLKYSGLKVKQIMNITDIGHLTSDADSGDDKMTKGLLREGKTLTLKNMRELAEFYTESFKKDLKTLNIKDPSGMYFASDYVKEDIELIKKLEDKKYTYKTSDGIYFDISKMPDYGVLWGGMRNWNKEGARIVENSEKKNPEDFALWKFNNKIGFESPFGKGFPGWHIECSAMGIKFLGEQFDIHTGGIDLVPTHHTNEIAQSECATGKKPFVRFWIHNEFVDTGGEKMAKSSGNFLKIESLIERKINPIAYRFWLLMANYHTKVSFNWDVLEGSEIALKRLYKLYIELGKKVGKIDINYQKKFKEYLEDDLDTPRALSLLWDLIKDETVSPADKKATILDFDKVLGLGFENLKEEIIPENILKLVGERELARKNKDFKKSDELRDKINSLGYEIKDLSAQAGSSDGPQISKI
ncbi:cysteine--tRNA ligase [Candidatus Nomurabacteria bacterium CG_4_9_14_0_2_um_filter_32_10]|uniref:Cysteine--tRNA ligase n=2 Tax=Candidatus Nomuraibacteriota TaxID=1752729 RepID=A0A2J0MEN9_9BACT|nr:MAG: cysteine--tRNA ligase [Candidatus Nomurabacteria bacterium CG_4_10_14_0_2_um_filter_33_9]PJC49431.1 MAG: cysteine--tRNA ligase [Candidatus Nomurabacteria bacterium CG_4_9_14_0_2_um_filter_32_10]